MNATFAAAIVIGAVVALPASAHAQSVERSMYVSAVDGSGKAVTGLDADDFRVREDGQVREVLRATPATAPMDIALLVDNSQAAEEIINDLRRALEPFVTRLAGKGHQIALIGLADRPTVLVDYTSSGERLKAGVQRLFAQPGSGTLLLDGLVDVTRGLQRRESERRAIVVITTEGTDFSNLGYERTLEVLGGSGAQLFVFTVGAPAVASITGEEARNRSIVVDRGTRASGGDLQRLLTGMSIASALQRLADELENQYHVVFAHPGTIIPAEKVEVRAVPEGVTARGVLVPVRSRR
ncbi:MAG TPA: VWA domain-containing protein [Vicinamibacterales bacterium]|nr:VWA domain-containing protein [Vicinamibacterales bacterium]